jgi:hypothetical protein
LYGNVSTSYSNKKKFDQYKSIVNRLTQLNFQERIYKRNDTMASSSSSKRQSSLVKKAQDSLNEILKKSRISKDILLNNVREWLDKFDGAEQEKQIEFLDTFVRSICDFNDVYKPSREKKIKFVKRPSIEEQIDGVIQEVYDIATKRRSSQTNVIVFANEIDWSADLSLMSEYELGKSIATFLNTRIETDNFILGNRSMYEVGRRIDHMYKKIGGGEAFSTFCDACQIALTTAMSQRQYYNLCVHIPSLLYVKGSRTMLSHNYKTVLKRYEMFIQRKANAN